MQIKISTNNSGDFSVGLTFSADQTGLKYLATIKRDLSVDDDEADATVDGEVTGTSATITFPASVMAALSGEYYFDIALVDEDAGTRTPLPDDEPALLVVSKGATNRDPEPEE